MMARTRNPTPHRGLMNVSAIREVLKKHGAIRHAIAFGSMAAGRARPDSDLDIAVDLGHRLTPEEKMQLIGDLAASCGRPVDLLDLRTTCGPLLGQILKHGRRLVGNDADRAELIRRHVFDSEDFLPYVDRMLRERRQAWIG